MNREILTQNQVAEKYQVSERKLYNLRKTGELKEGIQYFYFGRQIRYKSKELQDYLENCAVVY